MTNKERIIKLEEEFNALLRNLDKEAVWKKEKTGITDNPYREEATVYNTKNKRR